MKNLYLKLALFSRSAVHQIQLTFGIGFLSEINRFGSKFIKKINILIKNNIFHNFNNLYHLYHSIQIHPTIHPFLSSTTDTSTLFLFHKNPQFFNFIGLSWSKCKIYTCLSGNVQNKRFCSNISKNEEDKNVVILRFNKTIVFTCTPCFIEKMV